MSASGLEPSDDETTLQPPRARIVTERLILRCWEERDAPRLKTSIDDSLAHLRAWMAWAMDEPSTLDVIERRLARFRESFRAAHEFPFAILDPDERELLGGIELSRRVGAGGMELGYWLRADRTGRGYATEAADALVSEAFHVCQARRVEIRCDPANAPSAAIAHRLGFRHVITLEDNTTTPDGRPRDTMVWEATRERYRPLRPSRATPLG